jgi:hypothetical protein
VVLKDRREACRIFRAPAVEIEIAMIDQFRAVLRKPES